MGQLKAGHNAKIKKYKQAVYFGEFQDKMRHGLGIMVYQDSRLYEGTTAIN